MRKVLAAAFLLGALFAGGWLGWREFHPPAVGTLEWYAWRAAREGRDHTIVSEVICPDAASNPLDSLIATSSAVVGTSAQVSAQTIERSVIVTWRVFNVERMLRHGPQRHREMFCGNAVPPAALRLDAGQVAIPLVQGSARIRGVTVTMGGIQSKVDFAPDRRYLLFVQLCPDATARLPDGAFDVFELTDAGALVRRRPAVPVPFMTELFELGTVEALETRILALSPGERR